MVCAGGGEASGGEGRAIGLIAGLGRFPFELARSLRRSGRRVVAAGLRELTETGLAEEVDDFQWLHLGEIQRLIDHFTSAGARDLVMAGKVPKTFLWERRDALRLDDRAVSMLAALRDRKDDSLLGAVVDHLEAEGFRVRGQAELAPELLAPWGSIGALAPTAQQQRDVAFGWPIAKTIGELDVGQTVVVQRGAVLALEAIEGTDQAIRRGCALGEPGATVVKVAKPHQDPRFDVPTIGLATLRTVVECGATAIAVEAARTVVLERAELVALADEHGIAVFGVDEPGIRGATSA